MKTTADFLNDIKNKYELPSNYALAKLMKQTETSVSRWIHGKTTLSDENSIQVAELLHVEPAFVIACVHAERSKESAVRMIWEKMANTMHHAAAVLVVVFFVGALLVTPNVSFAAVDCILCKIAGASLLVIASIRYVLQHKTILNWNGRP